MATWQMAKMSGSWRMDQIKVPWGLSLSPCVSHQAFLTFCLIGDANAASVSHVWIYMHLRHLQNNWIVQWLLDAGALQSEFQVNQTGRRWLPVICAFLRRFTHKTHTWKTEYVQMEALCVEDVVRSMIVTPWHSRSCKSMRQRAVADAPLQNKSCPS